MFYLQSVKMNLALYPAPFLRLLPPHDDSGCTDEFVFMYGITPLYSYSVSGTVCPPCSTEHILKNAGNSVFQGFIELLN